MYIEGRYTFRTVAGNIREWTPFVNVSLELGTVNGIKTDITSRLRETEKDIDILDNQLKAAQNLASAFRELLRDKIK